MATRQPLPARPDGVSEHHVLGRRVARAVACVVAIFLALPWTVLADPAVPDTLEVRDLVVVRNTIESGDYAILLLYNIYYSGAPPSQSAQELFRIRLMSVDGTTELGAVLPYPYHNSGYDYGLACLYFDSASAPTWETSYIVELSGNPAEWTTIPVVTKTLVMADFSGFEDQEANQEVAETFIREACADTEVNWDTTLLNTSASGTILSTTGETYVVSAVPGSPNMAPGVFYTQTYTPQYEERDWDTTLADTYTSRFADSWVGKGLQRAADDLHVSYHLLGTVLFAVPPFILVMIFCQRRFHDSTPALIAGAAIMLCCVLLGFTSMAVLGILGISYAMFIGYVLFFRTS